MKKGFALPLLIAGILIIAITSFAALKYYPLRKTNSNKLQDQSSELAICTNDSKNNLFPESLNLGSKTYPKIGYLDTSTGKTVQTSEKSELQEYGETGNILDLKIIWKDKNPESFHNLQSIYNSSKFEKVELHGEKILIITDSTNKNWQVYAYVPETVFVYFQPKSPGAEPPSKETLTSLFSDWFTKACTTQIEEAANLQKDLQSQTWIKYKNDEFGFQFELPLGWKTHEFSKNERTSGIFAATDPVHALTVQDYTPKTIDESLGEYKNAKGYENQEIYPAKVGGVDVTVLKTNASPVGNNKIVNYLMFIKHKDKTIFIQYASNNNDEETWKRFLDSLKFI